MRARQFVTSGVIAAISLVASASPTHAALGVYADLSIETPPDSVRLIAWGSAEDFECLGTVYLDIYLYGPGSTLLAADNSSGWCYASADAEDTQSIDSFNDGDYEARATASGAGGAGGCSSATSNIKSFQGVLKKSHYNALIGKWEYHKDSGICNGVCQPPKYCSTTEANWVAIVGARISTPAITYCKIVSIRLQSAQPACNMPFGSYLGGFNDECS